MAAGIETRIQKLLWPGLDSLFWGMGDQFTNQWEPIFEQRVSEMAFEEDVAMSSVRYLKEKSESTGIEYEAISQEFVSRYTNISYGLGMIVTEEEIEDNLYIDRAAQRTQLLRLASYQTKNIVHANILNRAFNGSYVGGDGVSLCNASHPTSGGGLQSNILDTASDLSEYALEQLLIKIKNARDFSGTRQNIEGQLLIVAKENMFDATRILRNPERPGTADRDINAIYTMGMLPKGILVNNYLEDPDAWFIHTNIMNGLKSFQRRPLTFSMDNDFNTGNLLLKVTERYVPGFSNWHTIYGTPGK